MLAYYRDLGVAQSLIHLHGMSDDAMRSLTQRVSTLGATVVTSTIGQWSVHLNTALMNGTRLRQPTEWFVVADHDEFQAYPDGLADAIAFCERHGYDYIEGCLVDRLAEDGVLRPLEPGAPIWDQYPLGSMVSKVAGGAVISKVVACRGAVQLSSGQHQAYSGIGCPPQHLYIPVHHFKWTAAAVPALRQRLIGQAEYSMECAAVLRHLDAKGGFDVGDPLLMAARCDPFYPFWERLLEWRLAAEAFSDQLTARRHQMAAVWAATRRSRNEL
jgi:hypothetical protein